MRVTPQTVRKNVKRGKLRDQRVGRLFLISEGNLFKFMEGVEFNALAQAAK